MDNVIILRILCNSMEYISNIQLHSGERNCFSKINLSWPTLLNALWAWRSSSNFIIRNWHISMPIHYCIFLCYVYYTCSHVDLVYVGRYERSRSCNLSGTVVWICISMPVHKVCYLFMCMYWICSLQFIECYVDDSVK